MDLLHTLSFELFLDIYYAFVSTLSSGFRLVNDIIYYGSESEEEIYDLETKNNQIVKPFNTWSIRPWWDKNKRSIT